MAKRQKYVELELKSDGMPRHFLSGYEIVSDHERDGKRFLFLRRPEAAIVPAPKPKAKKKATAIHKPAASKANAKPTAIPAPSATDSPNEAA